MKRQHQMPFGAECREDGTVRFRLWAPKLAALSVRLLNLSPRDLPMVAIDGGWFELVTDQARAGTRYQFVIDDLPEGPRAVPDPVSRFQPHGVHGPSEVIDPGSFVWQSTNWRGRPWDEAAIYELHVGTFTREGTYSAAQQKLDYLAGLGVTAIELMPISSFAGERNWGYDGVLPFAPAWPYGRPEYLKEFVESAHARNLMVLLDVVYNHFGPEGNYLWLYAPQFFTDRHCTPWGQAINFDGKESRTVRDYFIHNALYWLEEFHLDGLRLDAVHAILDDSRPDILTEMAEAVRSRFEGERDVHLVLENDRNQARYLRQGSAGRPLWYDGQWNDDIHHALHVLLTGDSSAHYGDYAASPIWHLGRCLAEGYSYQGEESQFRAGESRGEPSGELPPTCFVSFLQNHDQAGNRAFGERILDLADHAAVKAAMAILLLAPSPPLIFMGEEFAASTPFLFFCDFGPDLAEKVSAGRNAEFPHSSNPGASGPDLQIPDPNSEETFLRSKLDWPSVEQPAHQAWLEFYRTLLACRRSEIVPRIRRIAAGQARFEVLSPCAIRVHWPFIDSGSLHLHANLGASILPLEDPVKGRLLYGTAENHDSTLIRELPPLSVVWSLTLPAVRSN